MATIGLDLGGTNIYALVLDGDEVAGSTKRATPPAGDPAALVKELRKAARKAAEDAGRELEEIDAVGVGVPGVVRDGGIDGGPNVQGVRERFPLAHVLGEELGCPVVVLNDVTAAAIGEHRLGAGQGADDLLTVFAGTGVGGGLVLRGQPVEGRHGAAGEFGHMIVREGGAMCGCGRRGCVEAYAGRRSMEVAAQRALDGGRSTRLFAIAEEKGKDRVTSGVFQATLEEGDRLVSDLLDDAVDALGTGIASVVNLLDLELVVLGGGLADKLGEPFRARIENVMQPLLFLQPPEVRLVRAALGDEGGAIGAAAVARERAGA
ncbi:MAG: ROK family protein [Nitriliruptoraceae bacterium]